MSKERLDVLLVNKGLATSRDRGQGGERSTGI